MECHDATDYASPDRAGLALWWWINHLDLGEWGIKILLYRRFVGVFWMQLFYRRFVGALSAIGLGFVGGLLFMLAVIVLAWLYGTP